MNRAILGTLGLAALMSLVPGILLCAEKPRSGPDWGLRFAITFLFPK